MRYFWLAALFPLFLLLAASPAEAHRPYVIKVKMLEAPSGEPLVLERRFGDGIFVADPVVLQVRNKNGAVIAKTHVSKKVSVFCPSLRFCWAMDHVPILPIGFPARLDYEHLDYDREPTAEEMERGRPNKEDMEHYFAAPEGTFDAAGGYSFPDMEEDADKAIHFDYNHLYLVLLSPFFIVISEWKAFLILVPMIALPIAAYRYFRPWADRRTKIQRLALRIVATLLALAYALVFMVILLLGGMHAISSSTTLLFAALSVSLGDSYLKRRRAGKSAKNNE